MRTKREFLWLVLIFFRLSTGAHADALANGIYEIAEVGAAVRTLNGKEIHLGEKIGDSVSKVVVDSISNDNEQYSLSLVKESAFSKEVGNVALCVEGYCVAFDSAFNDRNMTFGMGARVSSSPAAEVFARFFGVTPKKRAHPGYALATRFVPEKDSFLLNEPLSITLEVKNVGSVPVRFQVGGKNRGARDNQFGFTAYGSSAVPDTGSPFHMGGESVIRTLKPGETFDKTVDLRKWFTFQKPGAYFITGTYDMSFFDPDDNRFVVWEDYAAARFVVRVK